jgi:chromosome segregation ATPase
MSQVESLRQEKTQADEELSQLQKERKAVTQRVEALLKRLDKFDV